jgi:hypothetical protein
MVDPGDSEVAALSEALLRGFTAILGDGLASFFLYGAVAFDRPEGWRIDFDFHVLLHRRLEDTERAAIAQLYADVGAASELGRDLDGYFVLLRDATSTEKPRHQLDRTILDEAWALHRAHVHAGRYFLVAGLDPREIVPPPAWPELDEALRGEIEFVEEHEEATAFGILNGARVLYSYANHDVVISKYQAAQWALRSLPVEWHAGVEAALRYYARAAVEGDERVLQQWRAPFVAYVKRSLPQE